MKHSVRKQFMLIFSMTMVGMILLCILANDLLLESFYIRQKEHVLDEAYKLIDDYSKEGGLDSDEFDVGMDQVAARGCRSGKRMLKKQAQSSYASL